MSEALKPIFGFDPASGQDMSAISIIEDGKVIAHLTGRAAEIIQNLVVDSERLRATPTLPDEDQAIEIMARAYIGRHKMQPHTPAYQQVHDNATHAAKLMYRALLAAQGGGK